MSAVVTSIEYVYLIPAEILTIQTLKEKKKKKKKEYQVLHTMPHSAVKDDFPYKHYK